MTPRRRPSETEREKPTPPYVLPEFLNRGQQWRLGYGWIVNLQPFGDDRLLIVASGGARMIDLRTDATLWEVDCPTYAGALSPDESRLALIGLTDAHLWDANTGALLWSLVGIAEAGQAVAFSPDGQLLATTSYWSENVTLWNVESGTEVRRLKLGEVTEDDQPGGYSVAFSPDGSYVAAGSKDGFCLAWRVSEGELTRRFEGSRNWVTSLAFSPDGRYLASGSEDHTFHFWEWESGGETYRRKLSPSETRPDFVVHTAFSPDGRIVFTGGDGVVLRWDAASGLKSGPSTGFCARFPAFSRDGRSVAAACSDGGLRFCDAASGEVERTVTGVPQDAEAFALSPDGRFVAFAPDLSTIELRNAETGRVIWSAKAEATSLEVLTFSPDGRILASGGRHGGAQLWSVETGEVVHHLVRAERRRRGVAQESTLTLAFSPDGQLLAMGGTDQRVRLWDTKSGTEKTVLPRHAWWVYGIAFSPDSRLLASGSGSGSIGLWDVAAGRPAGQLLWTPGYPGGNVSSLAFSPDGALLATGCEDGMLNLFHLETGQIVWNLKTNNADLKSVAFNSDGSRLLFDSGGVVRLVRFK